MFPPIDPLMFEDATVSAVALLLVLFILGGYLLALLPDGDDA